LRPSALADVAIKLIESKTSVAPGGIFSVRGGACAVRDTAHADDALL
jgi:hypothetical protein